MKTMRMTMRTMIRKAKLGSSFYRVSLLSTWPRRLPSYSLHRICNPPPPALSSFYWGKTVLEGWAKWSCIVIKPPPLPMELRATQQPSTSLPPAPRFSGIPALSIPQFYCRPLVMYLVWELWDWYLVFGSVLLIFCWMIFFSFFVEFIISLLSFLPPVPYFFPQ